MRVDVTDDRILETWDTGGGVPFMREIHLDVLAAYSALLGLDDPGEAVEAVNQICDQAAADPGLDDPALWAETINVLAGGTPGQAERRARVRDIQAGRGQPEQWRQARQDRADTIEAAHTRVRAHWHLNPPGHVGRNPDLAPLADPALTADIAARREAWLASITPITPEDQTDIEEKDTTHE